MFKRFNVCLLYLSTFILIAQDINYITERVLIMVNCTEYIYFRLILHEYKYTVGFVHIPERHEKE